MLSNFWAVGCPNKHKTLLLAFPRLYEQEPLTQFDTFFLPYRAIHSLFTMGSLLPTITAPKTYYNLFGLQIPEKRLGYSFHSFLRQHMTWNTRFQDVNPHQKVSRLAKIDSTVET